MKDLIKKVLGSILIGVLVVGLIPSQGVEANNKIENIESNIENTYTIEDIQMIINDHNKKIYVENLKTNEDLMLYSKEFLKEQYNLDLDILVEFNSDKEKDIRGAFYYNIEKKEALYIDINTNLECQHEIERTLIHELCHYALFKLGKNFDDGQEDFEVENYKNGGRSNKGFKAPLLDSKINSDCCN